MFLLKKIKDENEKKYLICNIPIFVKMKKNFRKKIYILGIKIFDKKLKKKQETLQSKSIEEKLLLLGLYYKDLPEDKKLIICMDALHDKYAEAIDAYTFFQFLQARNIPSKYILLKDNPLYEQLKQQRKLKDILLVEKQSEFIEKYSNDIARSKCILTSFGLSGNDNKILKNLPFLQYIFIEHGVILLKKWVVRLYDTNLFNKILVPSQATYNLYNKMNLYAENEMICSGLPRWDNLNRISDTTKNIFLFFTWRYSLKHDKEALDIYYNRIKIFIDHLQGVLKEYPNIKIYMSLHHAVCLNLKEDISFDNIQMVSPNEISKMISKTDLLITDYSSICFDFMYLDIPVIFYRFDSDVHYSNSLDNETMISACEEDDTLYNCLYTEDDVLSKVKFYMKNRFELEPEYKAKNKVIFWKKESECQRLLNKINHLSDE